jgi:hypothetical protein
MNRLINALGVFAAISLLISACGGRIAQAKQEQDSLSKSAAYQTVLGKSLQDSEVVNFIASNNCSTTAQFRVCKDVGMDLWINASQIVQTVYLYLNNDDGYSAYKSELPFGLKFYDIQGAVEYKLKRQDIGNAGLPDEGSSPDHFHYWAVYEAHNMIIIYNSPHPDEDATIYAIVVSQ